MIVVFLEMPRFILTGFGPFENVPVNPSSDIVTALRSRNDIVATIPNIPVSIAGVDAAIGNIAGIQSPCDVIVHFGVDMTAHQIKLESVAYNEKNFRIPDIDGKVCFEEGIVDGGEPMLKTGINLGELHSPYLSVSYDPGRYICNLLYYKSLHAGWNSVFIHIPPCSAIPMEKQLEVVNCILNNVA